MKAIIILIFLIGYTAFSQSLSLFDVDASNFPTIKAKFFAFDKDGNQITNLTPSDFELKENGVKRNVTMVSCPIPKTERLSIVLAVDVTVYNNINNAKTVLNAWLDIIPLDKNEIAIMSYEGNSYINQDFTTDKVKLQRAINSLTTLGSREDHTGALIRPITGAISVAKKGKYKPIVVVLSSCSHFNKGLQSSIIEEAKKHNVTINFNIFDKYDWTPDICRNISKETGGFSNNHIPYNDLNTAINSIKLIMAANKSDPCTIEWKSGVSCFSGITNVELTLLQNGTKATAAYQSPSSSIARLEFNPTIVRFDDPQVGVKTEQKVTVKAINADFTVTNITGNSPKFDIAPKQFMIKSGESIELTVSYTPTDSGYNFCRFEIETDQCPTTYFASGGWKGKKPSIKTLKVTHPNGGEVFVVGSDTVITWEGISSEDLVKLEYSTDNGKNWKYIDTARGLRYSWNKVPRPASNQCKVKVKQMGGKLSDNNFNLLWTTLALGRDVKWSPDGRRIVTCASNVITILDANTLDTIMTLTGHSGSVYSVSYSPDGRSIASGSSDNTIKIWESSTGVLQRTLTGHSNDVESVSYSPDGRYIASGSYDGTIKIWDANTGVLQRTLTGHSFWVLSVSYSPDGRYIASGGYDGTIKIWEASTGVLQRTLTGHSYYVYSVSYSPDGRYIASGSYDGTIKIWEASTGVLQRTLTGHSYWVYSVSYSPDGRSIASGSRDGTIKIWEASTGVLQRTLTGHSSWVWNVSYSPDGRSIASGSRDGTIKIWEASTGVFQRTLTGHSYGVSSVSYSPDGRYIASGSDDETIKIRDASTGVLQRTLTGHSWEVTSVSYSPDGRYIALGSWQEIKIWESSTGVLQRTLTGHSDWVECVSYSPDGRYIASGSRDNTIKIWDATTGALIRTLTGHSNTVTSVSYSPDGRYIASGSYDRTIKIWDANTGVLQRTLTGHSYGVLSVSYSPDGRYIASGSDDRTIKLWDATTGVLLQRLTGHSDVVRSVSYSPDGRSIASGSEDGTIKIWESSTGVLQRTLTGHSGWVLSVSYSPDGRYIASGSSDATLKVWAIDDITLQEDESDNVFSIVEPIAQARDIDMGKVLVGSVKDSVVTSFVQNIGSWKFRVESIYFRGADASAFSLVSGFPKYEVKANDTHYGEFRFKPTRVGIHTAEIVIITQSDTLVNTIRGEGVEQRLEVVGEIIDFGIVKVGRNKDTLQTATIKNIGSVAITITETKHNLPNDKDFKTLSGGGSFTLQPGETRLMDLRFAPSDKGRTSGTLEFHYNGVGSPAVVQLFGEGEKKSPMIQSGLSPLGNLICETEKTNEIQISNTGGEELIISELNISGTNSTEFEIKEALPITIPPDSTKAIIVTFRPQTAGDKTAELVIKSNSEPDSVMTLQLKGRKESIEYSLNKKDLDFGYLPFNQSSELEFEITNKGTLPNTYKLSAPGFITLSEINFTLNPNESKIIKVFYPGSSIPTNILDSIIIEELTCKNLKKVNLLGTVYSANAQLKTIALSGYAGEEIEIPIILNEAENLAIAGVNTIDVELTFNPTLLSPIGYQLEKIDDKTARIKIENLPVNVPKGEAISKIKCVVGLGNAEGCELVLSNAQAKGGQADITLINGKFTLLGICEEGGKRLINPARVTQLMKIAPNPSDGNVNIELNLVEKGLTSLKIYNQQGILVEYRTYNEVGKIEITLNTENYSNGLYFIELQTPTIVKREKLMIMK